MGFGGCGWDFNDCGCGCCGFGWIIIGLIFVFIFSLMNAPLSIF